MHIDCLFPARGARILRVRELFPELSDALSDRNPRSCDRPHALKCEWVFVHRGTGRELHVGVDGALTLHNRACSVEMVLLPTLEDWLVFESVADWIAGRDRDTRELEPR